MRETRELIHPHTSVSGQRTGPRVLAMFFLTHRQAISYQYHRNL